MQLSVNIAINWYYDNRSQIFELLTILFIVFFVFSKIKNTDKFKKWPYSKAQSLVNCWCIKILRETFDPHFVTGKMFADTKRKHMILKSIASSLLSEFKNLAFHKMLHPSKARSRRTIKHFLKTNCYTEILRKKTYFIFHSIKHTKYF